jgi:hypothetical protein
MGEGDCTLHTDDDSDALHTDGGSNVPSGGNDATVSEGIGRNDILAAGEGDDALHGDDGSATLQTDNGNDVSSRGGGLDAHIPGGDLVVSGALNAGYRRTCGLGRGILAGGDDSLGEGGRQPRRGWVRRTRPQRRPNVSGQHGWLYRRPRRGRRWPRGREQKCHPPGCAAHRVTWHGRRRPRWLRQRLHGRCSTSDLAHHQRPKMLLSLSESRWGPSIIGWDIVNKKNKCTRLSGHFSRK